MCLIIHKPAEIVLTKEQLTPVFERNSDGFGLMFLEDNNIKTLKILPKSIDEVMAVLEPHMNKELGIHFRMQTHGTISLNNVHPYKIFDKESGAPFDAYLMHNGILTDYTLQTEIHSDTYNFINQFINPIVVEDGFEIVHTHTFKRLLNTKISSTNRLLLLTNKGFTIINESAGSREKIPNTWCSNTYAFGTSTTTTYSGDYTNTNYPWGYLPVWFDSNCVNLDEKQSETLLPAKPLTSPVMATKIPDNTKQTKDEDEPLLPGIGACDYTELNALSDDELFALIVENPEDVFDLFRDYMDYIIEAIDQDLFADDNIADNSDSETIENDDFCRLKPWSEV